MSQYNLMWCILGAGLLVCPTGGRAQNEPETADVYVSGQEGYHTFRIPALAVTRKGTVLAFCEARKKGSGDAGDIDLVVKRSTDHGRTWGPLQLVHEEGGDAEITIGNPSPVVDRRGGRIHLLFTRNNQRAFHTSSTNDGRGFSPPVEITAPLRGFAFPWTRVATGPGHAIQLRSGRLLAPVWLNERIRYNYRAAVIYSDDHGKSWKPGGLVGPEVPDTNECMLAERSNGDVVINLRSKQHRRSAALSRDGGLTWSAPQLVEALPDPVCQASLLSLKAGGRALWLFANPASAQGRVDLTVRLSRDEGETWPVSRILHAGPAAYSDLIFARDGAVLCLYECGQQRPYERLRLARFPLSWLQ